MNREIKFIRYHFDYDGKYLDKSEWGQFKDHFSSPASLSNENKKLAKDCQFTGLSDKNSKEIYEGDIIYNYDDFSCICGYGEFTDQMPDKRVIKWCMDDCCYKLYHIDKNISDKSGSGYSLCEQNCKTLFEIIGNIYENPNLLK